MLQGPAHLGLQITEHRIDKILPDPEQTGCMPHACACSQQLGCDSCLTLCMACTGGACPIHPVPEAHWQYHLRPTPYRRLSAGEPESSAMPSDICTQALNSHASLRPAPRPHAHDSLKAFCLQMCQHSSSGLQLKFLQYAQSSQCRSKSDSSVSYAAAVALPPHASQ